MQADAADRKTMNMLRHSLGTKEKGKGTGTLQCPPFLGSITYSLVVDAIKENNNIYTYDGVLVNEDGSGAGFVAVGCTKSTFLTEVVFEQGAGVCTFELFLVEDDDTYIGTLTAAGSGPFDDTGIFTFATITGGDGCVIGKTGNIDITDERFIITFIE